MTDNIGKTGAPLTRRKVVGGLSLGFGIAGMSKSAFSAPALTPEAFGAVGDGKSSDGAAIARLVAAINAVPGTDQVTVECRGHYLLRGAPKREIAPKQARRKGGHVAGIPPITRDNVAITAWGAEFIVPPEFGFRRLLRGGDARDHFFIGLHFIGRGCSLSGGVLRGNLQNRSVERGPKPIGFGGNEFGLVMEGDGWLLDGVTSENWGTDCLLIGARGTSRNGAYLRARRNCVSVVLMEPVSPNHPIVIQGGVMHHAGSWPEDVYNNPSAGIDIEGRASASVILSGVDFNNNRLKDVQISKQAYRCIVENCVIRNKLLLRPSQRGGHVIRNNQFLGGHQAIGLSHTYADNEPVYFESNRCDNIERFMIFRRSKVKTAVARQKVVLLGNVGCS